MFECGPRSIWTSCSCVKLYFSVVIFLIYTLVKYGQDAKKNKMERGFKVDQYLRIDQDMYDMSQAIESGNQSWSFLRYENKAFLNLSNLANWIIFPETMIILFLKEMLFH